MSRDLVILRNSERLAFRRCEYQHMWAYREGLRATYDSVDALWFGTGVHEALAQWYKHGKRRGLRPSVAWANWCADEIREIRTAVSDDFNEDVFIDAKDLGIAMLEGYYEKYDYDENWDVIFTEYPFQVEIPHPHKPGKTLGILAGTFDGVYQDRRDGTIWLMEHKTAKNISIAHLPLDDQAGTYWMVASSVLRHDGVLKKGQFIDGINYNFLRKGLPDPRERDAHGRYLNKDGSISKVQPKPLFHREPVERGPREQHTQLARIQNEMIRMKRLDDGKDERIKSIRYDCPWCPFFDMCELHEKGNRAWMRYRDSMYHVEDPYADHRKSAHEAGFGG